MASTVTVSVAFTSWPEAVREVADMFMLPVLVMVMPVASVRVPTEDSAEELAIGIRAAEEMKARRKVKMPKVK